MPFGNVVDKNADGIFQGYFGRVPQVFAFREAPNSISIPAVTFASPPKDGPPRTAETKAEQDLLFYYPGGFRIVDPKSLIARGISGSQNTAAAGRCLRAVFDLSRYRVSRRSGCDGAGSSNRGSNGKARGRAAWRLRA
jgi:hypothetical protein